MTKKIIYPRYSRNDDLRCKVSDENIKEIKELRKEGLLLREIAEKFNVSICCIHYWLLSQKERNELNEKIISYGYGNKPYTKKAGELKNRKYRLCPEYKEYIEQFLKYKPYCDRDEEYKQKRRKRYKDRYLQRELIINEIKSL